MRFSRATIAGLMGAVFIAALGLTALRSASDAWAGTTLLATCGVLSLALVGAVCRSAAERSVVARLSRFRLGLSGDRVLVARRRDNAPDFFPSRIHM